MGSSDKEVADTVVDGDVEPVRKSVIGSLSFIDRFLSVWILSVMVIGVVVGFYSPETQRGLSQIEGTSSAPMLKSDQLFHWTSLTSLLVTTYFAFDYHSCQCQSTSRIRTMVYDVSSPSQSPLGKLWQSIQVERHIHANGVQRSGKLGNENICRVMNGS